MHSIIPSVIIKMPKIIVTYIGKIKQSEAVKISSESYVLSQFFIKNHVFMMEKLIDIMEEDDDVQNIWHNWEE